jgi:hypothetical protein
MDPAAPTTTKVKMSGYLHLKNKKVKSERRFRELKDVFQRMMSNWKNYWFVLEDRLLLFYRSKDEYQAISPCKGSINLGPPCAVKSLPSVANAFQVVTRTVTYTLVSPVVTFLVNSQHSQMKFGWEMVQREFRGLVTTQQFLDKLFLIFRTPTASHYV